MRMFIPAVLAAAALLPRAAAAQHEGHAHDSSFHAMQERGKAVMGVDQYTSVHHFDDYDDGGRIALQAQEGDSAGIAGIRAHMKQIAVQFKSGDFRNPMAVHQELPPGATTMAARRDRITYTYRELPRGGEVRIRTRDPDAVRAVHEFLAYQRREHRTKAGNDER